MAALSFRMTVYVPFPSSPAMASIASAMEAYPLLLRLPPLTSTTLTATCGSTISPLAFLRISALFAGTVTGTGALSLKSGRRKVPSA